MFIKNEWLDIASWLGSESFFGCGHANLIAGILSAGCKDEIRNKLSAEGITDADIQDIQYINSREEPEAETETETQTVSGKTGPEEPDINSEQTGTTKNNGSGDGGQHRSGGSSGQSGTGESSSYSGNRQSSAGDRYSKDHDVYATANRGGIESASELGRKAEEIVAHFLEQKDNISNVKNMNKDVPNHPGFYFEFKEGDERIFAEVRGAKYNWAKQPHIGLKKTQLEEAYKKGKNYRLYIVENIKKEEGPEAHPHKYIHQIDNPWEKLDSIAFHKPDWLQDK